MTSQEILEKYLNFYKERGHKQVPNVSLIPEGDSTLLFVNSGMFPLVPYLSGQEHPLGKRLVNVQRAGRFDVDLEEVGDSRHTTAFHMIGNWSLGDYFKDQQLPWAFEFLIEEVGLDPKRLFPTVFAGDEFAPKDEVSIKILQEIFAKYGIDAKEGERIFACGRDKNWWQRGEAIGELGGPDSEVYYYVGKGEAPLGVDPSQAEDDFLEIGNSVFMQYKKSEKGWEELPQKNVDFGGGLERIAMVVQGKSDIFETDNFYPLIQKIEELSGRSYTQDGQTTKAMRIIADHARGATYMAMDGVIPGNKDQGYLLRRLIRRMVRFGKTLGVEKDISVSLVPIVVQTFAWLYPDLPSKQETIQTTFALEEEKFRKTLNAGAREFEKRFAKVTDHSVENLAEIAFDLYQSVGYPVEMFVQDLKEKNISVENLEQLVEAKIKSHQDLSRAGAEQKFKGGLADHSESVVKYHTATHLLHLGLRKVLGDQVVQQGSNITGERLRFDFNHFEKLSDDQVKQVEKIINDAVDAKLHVNFEMMPKEQAEKTGAIHAFGEKYGDSVKVYFIGESLDSAISKEFCGGPHVSNTSEIGHITIYKQEKIGEGKMRMYAKFRA